MVKNIKIPVWKQYIDFQNKYSKIYGDKSICFMQVGSFYEIYSIEDTGYIKSACDIMGIAITQKQIEGKPYMAGMPDHGVKKFLDRLIDDNYTVIIIDQIGTKNSKGEYETREVSKIISRSNLDLFFEVSEKSTSSNLLSIYMEEEKTLQSKIVITIGLSVIDLSTGINYIYEINSITNNIFEEMYRFIESYNPSEIIIHTKNVSTFTKDDIINKINMNNRPYYFNFYENNSMFLKLSYQEALLKKIFPNTGMLNVFDYLDLQFKLYALNSYILLLQFAYEHQENIIKKIGKPKIYESNKHLNLYNNALYQLDVVSSKMTKGKYNGKIKSLYDVINHVSTAMGRRELKNRILNPITDSVELNKNYEIVERMLDRVDIYESKLKNVLDIERYHRRLTIKMLQPTEYANINISYKNIADLLGMCDNDFAGLLDIDKNDIELYNEYYAEYTKIFNVDVMINYNIKNIDRSFFNKGLYVDIDEFDEKIDASRKYFDDTLKNFIMWINEYESKSKKTAIKNNSKDIVNLIYQEKQGNKMGNKREGEYFYVLNKRRGDILREILKSKKMDGYKIETHTKTDMKIVSNELRERSTILNELVNEIDDLVRNKYLELLEYFDQKYNFNKIFKFISDIDVIKSFAKTAKLFNYCKPQIVNQDRSFIDAKDIRHPIVERLSINTHYVPNDINLSSTNNEDGMLLFSLNAAGKSTYLKSVGLNIILAQMGCYVAAKEFKYSPYHHIFTRVSGDDNIFYGQSSFALEMSELRSILTYANENSLVLGDEVCRGTETTSALAIVSSTLNKFSQNRINFIFATHLHKLSEMKVITDLKNIGIYHLSVDTTNDSIKYERKLKRGSGESIYGLEVAKHLIHDKEFIDFAYAVRNELLNVPEYVLQPKSSKYNSDIYIDKCEICGKTYKDEQLDVHHILFQCNCDNDGMIDHIKKNDKNNLVVLCKEHHIQVHNKNLEIYGYTDTENGSTLSYKFIDNLEYEDKKRNRLKYDEKTVEIIEQFKGKPLNYVIKKLNDEYNIKISRATLNKIYSGTYGN